MSLRVSWLLIWMQHVKRVFGKNVSSHPKFLVYRWKKVSGVVFRLILS